MRKNKFNPIRPLMQSDSYKVGHYSMLKPGISKVLLNLTPRGARDDSTHVVHFGTQAFIQSYLMESFEPFFAAEEDEVSALYEEFTEQVFGPNNIGSSHIRSLHRLGYLPLKFRALPEGALVPVRVPFFTVENTHDDFAWLPTYIETALISSIWHPATTATRSYKLRQLIDFWSTKTSGTCAGNDFIAHDFSSRGQHSIESAGSSGAAHLLSFHGSDANNAINFVEDFYPGENNGMLMGSVPATEHSTMMVGGKANEKETYSRLMSTYPSGILSVVSDTWDLWNVITSILPDLKEQILARDGKLVIRPDSGDPVDIVTGTRTKGSYRDTGTPEEKGVVELLWDLFGGTVNEQGYKVLDPHIGVIYGDGLTFERVTAIYERLEDKGFASTNVVLGMGAYFMSGQVTRDTYEFGYKVTSSIIDGVQNDEMKNPVTDSGMKKSAKGRLAVIWKDDDYELVDGARGALLEGTDKDMLTTVWEDGEFKKLYSFAEVRENLHPAGL